VELIWDQMWRASTNYGRKGLTIQCISALDIALWDALGKLRNEPVFNLLGGRTKVRMCVCGGGGGGMCAMVST
jgi:L-rhamnonate dehydratase